MANAQSAFVSGVVVATLAAFLGFQATSVQRQAAASAPRAAEPVKLAVFDVLAATEKLFLSDRYKPAIDARVKQRQDELAAMDAGAKDLVEKIQKLPESSPDRQGLINTFQAKRQELEEAKNKAQEEVGAFSTEQFGEAYRACVQAATSIAKAQGYTHVFATRVGKLDFRSKEIPAALQEVLARPVLLAGEADDITAAVLKELKLDEAPAGDKKPEAPKAPEQK